MVRVESRLWTLWLVPLPGLALLLLLLVPEDQREGGDGVVVLLGLGLAGRLREGGPYDVPGPAVADRSADRSAACSRTPCTTWRSRRGATVWRGGTTPAPRSCDAAGGVARRGWGPSGL